MRILLADAQPHIRSALQILLKYEPGVHVVGEASDATSLLTQLQTIRPDVILLDWELPGLAAMGSLSALRADFPQVSVIALGGQPETRQEALAAGADAFTSKIDPPERLLAALHGLDLREKRLTHHPN
jgi:DNA-binding NarL/FixJ family response regulator